MHNIDDVPSGECFKLHFEEILNPSQSSHDYDVSTDVTIPILDEPISQEEVSVAAHSIMVIATLFNRLISDNEYSISWARAKNVCHL